MICKRILYSLVVALLLGMVSCGKDDNLGRNGDEFDRQAMLINWADNIIIPSYKEYVVSLGILDERANTFKNSPAVSTLETLRTAWLNAYVDWQKVAMFEIGKAEEITLRNFTNVFPVNVVDMKKTISSGTFSLPSVNRQDEQGFPALDYLINGLGETDQEIVDIFLQETAQSNHGEYLVALTDRLKLLGGTVLSDWRNGYRDTFITNDGSEALSSVNKLVNDLLFYYEKHLRAGKIGIPAGVFSSTPLSDRVEALYSQGNSKALFSTALNALEDFFNGKHVGSSGEGESLKSYLNFLNTVRGGENLANLINSQFTSIKLVASDLGDDFEAQVISDNTKMLATYDELQKNVVFMKVDMFQSLNIRVDFVDADGD